MTDQLEMTECALCGRDGGPVPACSTCNGRAGIQSKAFTLSEMKKNPELDVQRYGPNGKIGPKTKSSTWAGNDTTY